MQQKSNLVLTVLEALPKIQQYCVYQDRCHSEVRNKLLKMKVFGDDLEEILYELIQDKFLDEERFARSFARGKFRFKGWGRRKIELELKKRSVSDYCISQGFKEIEEEDYVGKLKTILLKKKNLSNKKGFELRLQLFNYSIRKGYEIEITNEVLNEILSSHI